MNYFHESLQQFLLNLVQKNKAIRNVVIKSHEWKITTAAVTVLRGLLCCKWIYQSLLCIGA